MRRKNNETESGPHLSRKREWARLPRANRTERRKPFRAKSGWIQGKMRAQSVRDFSDRTIWRKLARYFNGAFMTRSGARSTVSSIEPSSP